MKSLIFLVAYLFVSCFGGYIEMPCHGTCQLDIQYSSAEEENSYTVFANISIPNNSQIRFQFDAEAIVLINNVTKAMTEFRSDMRKLVHITYKEHKGITFKVRGVVPGVIPLLQSLVISKKEYCNKIALVENEDGSAGERIKAVEFGTSKKPGDEKNVKRRQISVSSGAETEPLNWPWHVFIYKNDKYMCGGTLVSKDFVLTIAHCTTENGQKVSPAIMGVVLTKQIYENANLINEQIKVDEIIVHGEFRKFQPLYDISLLKLKTMLKLGRLIQRANLWYNGMDQRMPSTTIQGTVVGWDSDNQSMELVEATMPMLPYKTCIERNPIFYGVSLAGTTTFCAGFLNGTSPCNGDSGAGFHVLVPPAKDASPDTKGSWYLRGIVSMSLSVDKKCDSHQPIVLVDVAAFKTWVEDNMAS